MQVPISNVQARLKAVAVDSTSQLAAPLIACMNVLQHKHTK